MIKRRDLLLGVLVAPLHRLLVASKPLLASSAVSGLLTTPHKVKPSGGNQVRGLVTATTSDDGKWIYITMPPTADGPGLSLAFAVQFAESQPSRVDFSGEAQIGYWSYGGPPFIPIQRGRGVDYGDPPYTLAVALRPTGASGWFLSTNRYGGQIPTGLPALDAVGIVRYWWSETARGAPSSHEEFVGQRALSRVQAQDAPQERSSVGPLGSDCPGSCSAGGSGSTGCSIGCSSGGSCSVTCNTGTGLYACCNCNPGPSCHCCSA